MLSIVGPATIMLASAATSATAGAAATSSAPATGGITSIVMTVVPSVISSALPSAITTTVPASEAAPLLLPPWLEVAAIFAGALATAMFAVRKKLDLVGVVTLAVIGGLGGGIMRDLLLQDYGIYALQTPRALIAALAGAALGAFFYRAAQRLNSAIVVMDAISLALFCVIGTDKAIRADLFALSAILLGIVTAVGGGVLRDVLTDSTPAVMQRGSLYASAALAGSTSFVLMVVWLPVSKPVAFAVAALLAFGLRVGSLLLGWKSPEPYDLTPAVAQVPAAVVSGVRRVPVLARSRRKHPIPESSEVHDAREVIPRDRDAEDPPERR